MRNFIVKNLPFLVPILKPVQKKWFETKYQSMSTEEIFTEIYKKKRWVYVGKSSSSGPSSELAATETIRNELPNLFKNLRITSLLDIPCGNFNWLKEVDLDSLSYTGADIVFDMIQRNKELYENKNRKFIQLDILIDKLPKVELILCRGLFMHLSLKDNFKAINNIKKSHSKYLLATSNIHQPGIKENYEGITGKIRPINLLVPPFSFPKPITTIYEKDPTKKNSNKSLMLWKIADLPNFDIMSLKN